MSDTVSVVYNDYVRDEKKKLKALLKKGVIEEIDYDTFYSETFFTLANTKQVNNTES